MLNWKGWEPWLQRAKRWHRRLHYADYEEARLYDARFRRAEGAQYEEAVMAPGLGLGPSARILIFKPDDIGDSVHALPALAELRRAFPEARLFLLCQEKTEPLFARTGLVDTILPFRESMRFLRFPQLDVKGLLTGAGDSPFDATLFLRGYSSYFSHFLRIAGKARIHPRDPLMRSDSPFQVVLAREGEVPAHQALQMLQLVSLLTGKRYCDSDIRYPVFRWSDADASAVRSALGAVEDKPFLVLHPFARVETRQYPYWPQLLRELRDRWKGEWVVIGGKEDPFLPELTFAHQMQGKLSLAETGYLLSRARGFVGNESGPGHLAAAQGVPVVTLWSGHSLPAEWAPLGKSLLVRAQVPCSPCYRKVCPGLGLRCLTELSPHRVLPEVDRFFRQTLGPESWRV